MDFFGGPKIPDEAPKPPPLAEPPTPDLAELAKQRKTLDSRRVGRSALVIDPNLPGTGIQIPM